jgi:hypothetical protein
VSSHQNPGGRGTSLVAISISEGAVVAVDDLLYNFESGVPVPAEHDVRKVFVSDNVIIASAQLIKARLWHPVSFEYNLKDWIMEFIKLKRGTPEKEPNSVSTAMYNKMRATFRPVNTMLQSGSWENQTAGDRIVSYIVAGYTKKFADFHLFEIAAQVNSEGNGLSYISPKRYPAGPQMFRLGEDESIEKAINEVQPFSDLRKKSWESCVAQASTALPTIPERLQDAVASAVSLVKLESQFNSQKVGSTVNVAVIDRGDRTAHSATF